MGVFHKPTEGDNHLEATMLMPIARMWDRIGRARQDGDSALFLELMYLGEMLTKLTVAAFVGCVSDDVERHRYRQLHRLTRADSLGEWPAVLDEVLSGPTSQHLVPGARDAQRQLTERVPQGSWQHDATHALHQCLTLLKS